MDWVSVMQITRAIKALGGLFLSCLLSLTVVVSVGADGASRLPLSASDASGAYAFSWTEASSIAEAAPQAIDPAAFEAEVIALVNQERARYGLYALVPHPAVMIAARGHSQDMAGSDFFSHIGSDGAGFVQRLLRAGYTQICAGGENIAAGQTSPQAVMSAWMSSSGHRANVLSTVFRDIGVGYVYEPDDTYPGGYYGYKHYWTQNFGSQNCWGPTPTVSGQATPTRIFTRVNTPTPTNTRYHTPTWTAVRVPTRTATPTYTSTPVWTSTPSKTSTPTNTVWHVAPSATPTLTATPTHTPNSVQTAETASLVGSIELQGRLNKPDRCWVVPLTVTLLRPDGGVYHTLPLYTTPYGEFILMRIEPGIYDVRVKNPITLANYKSTVRLLPGVNRVALGTLLAGDSSDDNVVDVLDFSLLRARFGTNASEADYNGDGVVDVYDFSLLRAHFGLSGDIRVN